MKKSVPIGTNTLNDNTVHEIIDILIKINAEEVLFALIRLDEIDKYCSIVKKYKPYFEEKNIKTAVWIDTLSGLKSDKYQNMQMADGRESNLVCPLCDEFVYDFCECTKKLAECGIKKIVLDDDFRMHMPYGEASCFCDKHIELYSQILGEKITKEIMIKNIYSKNKYRENGVINSAGRDFLNSNSFPAIFEPGSVNLIFGQNAHCFDKNILKNGTILDIEAAKILSDSGIDVGIESYSKPSSEFAGGCNPDCYEYYCDYNENVGIYGSVGVHNLTLKDGCEISSVINIGSSEYTGSYFYENAGGEKFFVYNFDAENDGNVFGLFKSYCRQKQLIKAYEKLSENKFEAICTGSPDLYMMAKKNDTSMAIGLWNYFADAINRPVIELSEKYNNAEFINCEGIIEGNNIIITSGIPAYGYCFIELN